MLTSHRLDIVLWSYSGYIDVLRITVGELIENSSTAVPIRVVLITDSTVRTESMLDGFDFSADAISFECVEYDEGEPFWKKIRRLRAVSLGDTFLFLQDDFPLFDRPDWSKISELASLLSESRCHFVRLVPSGIQTPKPTNTHFGITPATIVDYRSAYHFSFQATLWRSSSFMLVNRFSRARTIRDENSIYYRRIMRALGINGLAIETGLFPYVQTAVREGRWDYAAVTGGDQLESLLRKYGIDPKIRGVRTRAEVEALRLSKDSRRASREQGSRR